MARNGTPHRAALAIGIAVSVGLAERVARADDAANAAAAQTLFDEAKALMARDNFAEACPKLEDSQRLQPAGGTLMFLALCREGEGKTATAWAKFNEVISVARRDGRADRERVAQQHIADLTPKLVRLTIVVDGATSELSGLEVRRDGEIVPKPLWGNAVPVDPGKHALAAKAPGMKAWEASIEALKPGETVTANVPALEKEPNAVATAPAAAGAPNEATAAAPAADSAASGSAQRTIAIVVGAAGVVGVGVGSVFGIMALSKKSDSDKSCPGGSSGPCFAAGVDASKTAVADGNVSTIAFAAGGALLGAAAALWFTAPKKSSPPTAVRVAPSVGAHAGGLTVGASF